MNAATITLDAVVAAVVDRTPRLLVVDDNLPAGRLSGEDETLQQGMRRIVIEQAGIDLGYLEQLYTFGDQARAPGSGRHLSIAYLALVHRVEPVAAASWRAWYDLFPWEDRRSGSDYADEYLRPRLAVWAGAAPTDEQRATRRDRITISFGAADARRPAWDGIRVLERYELLYEAGAVAEAYRDRGADPPADLPPSLALGGDARRVVAAGMGRLRGKLTYRPVVFELMPERFTLSRLQEVVEALAGSQLHKQNFRRLVDRGGLVERTGEFAASTGGRRPELFRFRREVLLERPRPGLGHPSRG